MNYIGQKCQVCDLEFTENDDIVVCPICGTPHHRNCYETTGECINTDKHKDNYDWNEVNKPKKENICGKCGYVNNDEMLFCGKCGNPLGDNTNQNNTQQTQQKQTMPPNPFFTQDANGNARFTLDPLAGLPADTSFDDNVTAQDLADITKVNSFYYINVFNKIRTVGKSKFILAGFFFNSLWWIYRKMYLIGFILFAYTLFTSLFSIYYFDTTIDLLNQLGSNPTQEQISTFVSNLSTNQTILLFLQWFLPFLNLILMFFSGFLGNRFYYKHCKKVIKKVKNEEQNPTKVKELLNKIGGINNKAAVGCGICIFIITIFQNFI